MTESPDVFFITWPDGKVDEGSLTVTSAEIAKQRFIATYLPERYFGKLSWLTGYALSRIWEDMQEKGFKAHHIRMVDGKPEYLTP